MSGAEANAVQGKKLDGRLRGWRSELGSYIMVESDLMVWEVGGLCTFPPSEVTRNERSFKEERHRTSRQREWTTKHPLAR
jgi:hypothetical protein